MKALVIHGPGRFGVEPNWPIPQVRPGWARIRVAHAGICGSDLPRFTATGSYHHPMVLGHEFSGVVETPAPDSTTFHGGERVAILPIIPCGQCAGCRENEPFHCTNYQFLGSRNDGGFAEYCLVPESNLFRLPDDLDLRLGALIEPLLVGLHVVRRSGFRPGQSALVFGAGPIGLMTALWLQAFGARQIAVADLRPESLEIARQVGVENVVDSTQQDLAGLPSFDAAFEAAGATAALSSAIDKTRGKGSITVVGRDTRDTVIPLAEFERLMRKEIDLHACWGYKIVGESEFVSQVFSRYSSRLTPMITHRIGLDEAPDMIRAMAQRSIQYCKVLIDLEH